MPAPRSIHSNALVLTLSLALAAYTIATYPPKLVGLVAGGTALLVVGFKAGQRLLPRRQSQSHIRWSLAPLKFFLLVFSAASTIQVLVAQQYYGPRFTVDSTPGFRVLVLLVQGLAVAGIVFAPKGELHTAGLCLAAVYSSILYSPSFAAPEAAPPFVFLAALAVALLTTIPSERRAWPPPKHLLYPLLLFVVFSLAATLGSYGPHESWVWVFKLLVLLTFAALVPLLVETRERWNALAQIVTLASLCIPILLSAIKLFDLWIKVGLQPALSYKLMLNELGRANLIARTLVVGGPLLIAQAVTSSRRVPRVLRLTLVGLALGVLIACRSWGAWIAVALAAVFLAVLVYGRRCVAWLQERSARVTKVLPPIAILTAAGLVVAVALLLAPRANIESFNGRLYHARLALADLAQRPWLGVGPGQHYSQARYAGDLGWQLDNQATLDNPGRSIELIRLYVTMHTHNLFTEIGVGTGLLGLASFCWLLVALLRAGLASRVCLRGQARALATGCLVSLIAALGWGVLDVMEISPPLLTFPSWALIGLLLAAPRAFADTHALNGTHAHEPEMPQNRRASLRLVRQTSIWLAAIVGVLLPLLGSRHYRAAYLAYQERRWEFAAAELTRAERWQPFNAQVQELDAMSAINAGDYARAGSAYQRALEQRKDFAPYHAQLGWLSWLDGDLERAKSHLEQAAQADPREAWRAGVHAELALVHVAQGDVESALSLFQRTIELDPQMAQAPYWLRRLEPGGRYDVVLDPAYQSAAATAQAGQVQEALQRRILARLGKTDYTPRLLEYALDQPSPLSLNQVLDTLEADYRTARAAGSPEAPRLLAAAAEAAQAAGLYSRAERAYRVFQEDYSTNAYGFRGLGTLYRVQGRLDDARAALETAVEVSPRDGDSWAALAEVYADQVRWDLAAQALDVLYALDPLDVDVYRLWARLDREQNDPAQAAQALRQALALDESVSGHLALADLYRQAGDRRADEQCKQALDTLLHTRPRLWDAQLGQAGRCLARSDHPERLAMTHQAAPEIRQMLLGHIYRAQGEPEKALTAYQGALDPLGQTGPDVGAAYYFIAEAYQAMGDSDRAAIAYHNSARQAPLESLPLLALGHLQASRGQQQESLQSFYSAVTATPGSEAAHMALGNALLAQEDHLGAASHYRLAQIAARDTDDRVLYDLMAQLANARLQTPNPAFVRNGELAVGGIQQRTLLQHPESQVLYGLSIDQASTLTFEVALDPTSWIQAGDGVTFSVAVLPRANADAEPDFLWSTYIDPKHNQADRRWHSFSVDLGAYSGNEITLILKTSPGPSGDNSFDWAGWGTPRLIKTGTDSKPYSLG